MIGYVNDRLVEGVMLAVAEVSDPSNVIRIVINQKQEDPKKSSSVWLVVVVVVVVWLRGRFRGIRPLF